MISYLTTHWQPIVALLAGLLILFVYYFLHFKVKNKAVMWIAKNIFRSENMTPSAEDLFNVITSFLFMFGGIWVIVAIFYLANG